MPLNTAMENALIRKSPSAGEDQREDGPIDKAGIAVSDRLRLVMETISDLFIELDEGGRLVWVSPSFEAFLGIGRALLEGKAWASALEASGSFASQIGALLEGSSDGEPFEAEDAQGKLRFFAGRASPGLPGREGSGLFLSFHEVTERVAAEVGGRSAKAENEALLREVFHRTRNNMQVICALLEAAKADFPGKDTETAFDRVAGRIYAMSLVHSKLYESADLSRIDLRSYIPDLAERIAEEFDCGPRIRLILDLEPAEVAIDTAIPCGLILNELITNSYMHAFPGDRLGQVRIGLKSLLDGEIELDVEDDGIGLPENFDFGKSSRTGLRTVMGLGETQLYGRVSFGGGTGLSCRVTFRETKQERRF
jgi:PAS domain S-box-containing protein